MFKGISIRTILEIYNNPYDLIFYIWEKEGRWGFTVCRAGQGRVLLTSQPLVSDGVEVVNFLRKLLLSAVETANRGYITTEGKRLNKRLVGIICKKLSEKQHPIVNTSLFFRGISS